MKTYRCSVCGYNVSKDCMPGQCNYCSNKGCMEEIEDAGKIVDMIN
jgi:predicted nucleic acid binding AN1-type Zn finger protein